MKRQPRGKDLVPSIGIDLTQIGRISVAIDHWGVDAGVAPEPRVAEDPRLLIHPRHDLLQEARLLLLGSRSAELFTLVNNKKKKTGGREKLSYLSKPHLPSTSSIMRLVQVVLEIRNVRRAIVPVDRHEIDTASKRGARTEKVLEPWETGGTVGDGWRAE